MASVQREDVTQWACEASPVVQVESIEKGEEEHGNPLVKEEQPSEGNSHVHDAENIKMSYDVEEDVPPSLFQKLKGRFLGAEDKLRSEDAKKADPSPALASAHQSNGEEAEAISSGDLLPASRAPQEVQSPVYSSSHLEEKQKVGGGDELGTGYEEDSEDAFSSQTPSGLTDNPSQPESLFKPVKEKDETETTLEDLRASKLKENSNPEHVEAPGVVDRAKEEVEAVTDQIMEGLKLKDKRGGSGDERTIINEGGFFNRIAEKFGYGSHGRSQSQ